jgi:hypothetical protein
MTPRRPAALLLAATGVAGATLLAFAPAAAAHGIGGRSDLPLELWQFLYAAGAALVVSFLALRLLWPQARLTRASRGATIPFAVDVVATGLGIALRALGLVVWAVTIAAAWFGTENARDNLAPVLVYVVLWVGMQGTSAVLGDVWRALSPFDTLALLARWVRTRRWPGRVVDTEDDGSLARSHWPAVAGVFGFTWLELCYHSPDEPRVLAVVMMGYSIAVLAGAARYGRAWLRTGETFAVLFGLLALMSPFYRDLDGRLRVRAPFSGLATLRARRGTVAFVCVLLGSTGFDGVSRTKWWQDVIGANTGWDRTLINTLGMVWVIGIVVVVYVGASMGAAYLGGMADRNGAPMRFVASLVPIALAYAIAHYFSLFMVEGQNAIALLSDPFGEGWDLFGTATNVVNLAIVSTTTIAWVQVGSIVAGHIAGVVIAHDLAVEELPARQAVRSQYPMLAVMIVYTVGGLALLLGA